MTMLNTTVYHNTTFQRRYGMPVKAFLSMTPCFFFLYVNGVMLFTLRCKATFRETSRYILFSHLLISDSLHLMVSVVYYMFALCRLYFIGYVCLIVVIFAEIIASISPLNLAVMSLERYVAICFPLRHAEIASSSTTSVAIGVVWLLGSLNALTELFVYMVYGSPSAPMQVFCSRYTLFKLQIYINIDKAFTGIYFVSVGIVIVYTYIAIMVAAKSASSNNASVSKAHKTVLLHLIQLSLCLTSTLFNMINTMLQWRTDPVTVLQVQYVLFLSLIIFPRCLSPLIYGLKDKTFSHHFKYYLFFVLKSKVKPFRIVT